jgi:hypothetical protein
VKQYRLSLHRFSRLEKLKTHALKEFSKPCDRRFDTPTAKTCGETSAKKITEGLIGRIILQFFSASLYRLCPSTGKEEEVI